MADLTPKQQLFCLEYIKDFNATQAAIRAGYALEPCSGALAGFYVYLLCAPDGRILYVGKGSGRRYVVHIKDAKAGRIVNVAKHQAIRAILDDGGEVVTYCFAQGLDEVSAFRIERELIRGIGVGNLTNIAPGYQDPRQAQIDRAKALLAQIQPEEDFLAWAASLDPVHRRCAESYLDALKRLIDRPWPREIRVGGDGKAREVF